MAAYRRFYDYVTCRLTAKNRDQLRNLTLGNRVWAAFTFFYYLACWFAYSSDHYLEKVRKSRSRMKVTVGAGKCCKVISMTQTEGFLVVVNISAKEKAFSDFLPSNYEPDTTCIYMYTYLSTVYIFFRNLQLPFSC